MWSIRPLLPSENIEANCAIKMDGYKMVEMEVDLCIVCEKRLDICVWLTILSRLRDFISLIDLSNREKLFHTAFASASHIIFIADTYRYLWAITNGME